MTITLTWFHYWFMVKFATVILCAELWRMSGSAKFHGHWHRSIVLPILIAWYIGWTRWSLLYGCITFALLSTVRIGYGIPDSTDKGSFLGRIFPDAPLLRGICGLLYSLFVPFVTTVRWPFFWLNFTVGYLGSLLQLQAKIYERIIGASLASIVWFI